MDKFSVLSSKLFFAKFEDLKPLILHKKVWLFLKAEQQYNLSSLPWDELINEFAFQKYFQKYETTYTQAYLFTDRLLLL